MNNDRLTSSLVYSTKFSSFRNSVLVLVFLTVGVLTLWAFLSINQYRKQYHRIRDQVRAFQGSLQNPDIFNSHKREKRRRPEHLDESYVRYTIFPRGAHERVKNWHFRLPPHLKADEKDHDTFPPRRRDKLHIGIIPDGHRRWAIAHNTYYKEGIHNTLGHLKMCILQREKYRNLLRVGSISIYMASLLNLMYRDRHAMDDCFTLFANMWRDIKAAMNANRLSRIHFAWVGDSIYYPRWFVKAVQKDMERRTCPCATKSDFCVYFVLGFEFTSHTYWSPYSSDYLLYSGGSGRYSDTTAVSSSSSVNAWCTHPFLDIVIRTGGEKRLSGFLPMHTAYAELFFLDKMAPELTVEDIAGTMQEYDQRRKPYGR